MFKRLSEKRSPTKKNSLRYLLFLTTERDQVIEGGYG